MVYSLQAHFNKVNWWPSDFVYCEIVKMRKVKVKLMAMPMAVTVAFATQFALADTLNYMGPAYGGYVSTSGVYTSPEPITHTPAAGGLLMNTGVSSGSFLAWCLDVQGWLTSPANYSLQSGITFYPDPEGAVKIDALERLATAVLPLVHTKGESGAFQLAVWEIVNETGLTPTYSLAAGNFRVGDASDGALALAGEWLTNLNYGGTFTADTMTLSVWKDVNDRTQDLAVFAAPIPEPEIYAMMIAGLGVLSFVARRRKKAS